MVLHVHCLTRSLAPFQGWSDYLPLSPERQGSFTLLPC